MAVLQSTFGENIGRGFPGMVSNAEPYNTLSRHLEGSTACEFGRPVYRGTADKGVTLTVSADLIGFAEATHGLPETSTRPVDSYAPGDTIAVRNQGSIVVACATAAADGAAVYVTSAGAVTATASGNTAATGWVFDETIAAAGNVAIVRR